MSETGYSINLRVPIGEYGRLKEIEGEISNKELIRKIYTDFPVDTYVVADQLYSLIADEDGGDGGLNIPKGSETRMSLEGIKISLRLNIAVKLGLPGASILQALFKNKGMIFLKASSMVKHDAEELNPAANTWNRTSEEIAMSFLWHERMEFLMHYLNPDLLDNINNVISKADSKSIVTMREALDKEYGVKAGSRHNSIDTLAYVTTEFRDLDRTQEFIREIFPRNLAEVIIEIWKKAQPSENEVLELQKTALSMLPRITEKSYFLIVKEHNKVILDRSIIGRIKQLYSSI